jgi:hypothetical protein
MLLRDIWYLINLGQFDPINRMISLTVIPLNGAKNICLHRVKVGLGLNHDRSQKYRDLQA